ncbi:MAG: hypothetical protein ACKOWF_10245 [Chloroflexota bacterium]
MSARLANLANWIAALAAVGLLLMMPVTARAGLRDPHPHALLQLALDEGDGRLDHHAPSAAPGSGHAHAHPGRRVDPFGLGPVADERLAADAQPGSPPPDIPAASGGATWSPAAAGLAWSFLAVALAASLAAMPCGRRPGDPRAQELPPRGRTCLPELPPPRLPGPQMPATA